MMHRAILPVCLALAISGPAVAQKGPTDKDNTGTNPVNFTYDLRFYNEWAQFPDDGGSLSTQTFELRWPLGRNLANMKGEGAGSLFHDMGQLAALRIKARYKQLSIETPGASPFETSEVSGIGDFDVRVLAIPYARPKFVFAGGLEAFPGFIASRRGA